MKSVKINMVVVLGILFERSIKTVLTRASKINYYRKGIKFDLKKDFKAV